MSIHPKPAVQAGQTYTVAIEKVSHGGAGFASIDGLPVFIAGAVPGQQVEVVITKHKDRYAEGRVLKVLRKAKDEVMPRCQHFHDCGGCTWQNLPYDKQYNLLL